MLLKYWEASTTVWQNLHFQFVIQAGQFSVLLRGFELCLSAAPLPEPGAVTAHVLPHLHKVSQLRNRNLLQFNTTLEWSCLPSHLNLQPSACPFTLSPFVFWMQCINPWIFKEYTYSGKSVWNYLHKINPKIKYWFGFERSGSTWKLTYATQNIRQKLIWCEHLLKSGIYKLIAIHLLECISHNF